MSLLKSLLRKHRPVVAPPPQDDPFLVDDRPGADRDPRDYHRRSPVAVVRLPGGAAGREDGGAAGREDGGDRLLQSPRSGRKVARRMASDPPDRQPDGFISVTSRKYRYFTLQYITYKTINSQFFSLFSFHLIRCSCIWAYYADTCYSEYRR